MANFSSSELQTTSGGLVLARREMRRQIALLETRLSQARLDCARGAIARNPHSRATPSLMDLRELERERDELVREIAQAERHAECVERKQAMAARKLEAMESNPRHFKFSRVTNRQLGLPSCKRYEVKPRLGLLGMLAGWWEVTISSGCP